MFKTGIRYLLFVFVPLILLNVWFFFQQPGMIFYPYAKLAATPKDWGLVYEDVVLTTADQVKVHGWYLPTNASNQVVLFFHGNGGNISHRGESLEIFYSLGLNVLIIDYRGYGKSEGVMSEQGAYLDAMAAWKYLIDKRGFQPQQIIIFGRSLGGAIATQLATQVNQRLLIIESTFSSVEDMATKMMPVLAQLVWLRYDFNTEKRISQVDSPILLMHSQDDEIVPYELAEKVFAAAKSPKFFFELKGSHNGGFMQNITGYKQAISWFVENN